MPEKIIRDPVHDLIAFRLDDPVDALLFRLLNAREFQRLRRIRQLGLASLTYPGADHSRYSHSLGVMETARRILHRLRRDFSIDDSDATTCLAAALLHDLGHGPFSHVFERVSGIHHETLTQWFIENPDSDVHHILADHDPELPQRISRFMTAAPPRTCLHDIHSSQLDADRFDYLLRDSYMTGSKYGGFDLGWLIQALTIDPASQRLAVAAKGLSAVEAYLQSRYHMYRNVYFHKVVRAAEGMTKLALQRAARLAVQDRLPVPQRDDGVYKALLNRRLELDEFIELDDIAVLHCLKTWTRSDDPVLAGLCNGLLYRQLFKSIDLTHITDPAVLQHHRDAAAGAVQSAGGDPAYDLFYDQPSDTPYEIFDGISPQIDILVLDSHNHATSLAAISPLPAALGKQLMFRRLHVAPRFRDAVQTALSTGSAPV